MINQATLTYAELKRLLPTTKQRKLPTKKILRETSVFLSYEEDDIEVTVYATGWILYRHSNYSTVFGVDRFDKLIFNANEMLYGDENGVKNDIPHQVEESVYEDCWWFLPIYEYGELRIENNAMSGRSYYEDLTDFQEIDVPGDWLDDPLVALTEKNNEMEWIDKVSKMHAALDSLPDKQQVVLRAYYSGEGVTERAIAKQLNVSHQAVHKALVKGKENIIKNYQWDD